MGEAALGSPRRARLPLFHGLLRDVGRTPPPASLEFVAGDLLDYYYNLLLPSFFAAWFALPGVELCELFKLLEENGGHALAHRLRAEAGGVEGRVGVRVLVMGWTRAVFLAQSFLMDQVLRLPGIIVASMNIEGAPAPVLARRSPYLSFVHFNDIGFIRIVTCEADHQGLIKRRERLKANLRKIGLEINKIAEGVAIVALGHDLGRSPPRVVAAGEAVASDREPLAHRPGRASSSAYRGEPRGAGHLAVHAEPGGPLALGRVLRLDPRVQGRPEAPPHS